MSAPPLHVLLDELEHAAKDVWRHLRRNPYRLSPREMWAAERALDELRTAAAALDQAETRTELDPAAVSARIYTLPARAKVSA